MMPLLANAEQMSWGTPRSAKLAMRKLLVDIRQTRTFSWPTSIVPVYRLPLSVVTSPAVIDLLGVLAYGELVAFERTAADAKLAPNLTFIPFVTWSEVLAIVPMLYLVGVGTTVLAASITLRRYLKG